MNKAFRYTEVQWTLVIIALWIFLIGPGKIEGRFFPAAKPMEVIVTLPTGKRIVEPGLAYNNPSGRNTALWALTARLRHPNCSFRKIEWFLGKREDGNNVPVSVLDLGPPIVRPGGEFTLGPVLLRISQKQFKNTYADVLHQCETLGIPHPWLTRSRFWQ